MNIKIEKIPGLTEKELQALREARMISTGRLLENAGSATGRKFLVEKTGLTEKRLLQIVHYADLFRIKGMGTLKLFLLDRAKVSSLKDLRKANPEKVYAAMVTLNHNEPRLVRVPGLPQVIKWVQQAQKLQDVVK